MATKTKNRIVRNGAVTTPTTQEDIVRLLAEKGAIVGQHNAFTFQGEQNVGPETYQGDPSGYEAYVKDWAAAQREETVFVEEFTCLFGDGALAVSQVANKFFGGFTGKRTMFSLPEMVTIKTGPLVTDTIQVPSGLIEIKQLDAQLWITNIRGFLAIKCKTVKGKEAIVRGLLELVREHVAKNSIYRGKSIRVESDYEIEFMQINEVDPRAVHFNDHTYAAIRANIWTAIERPEELRKAGLPVKANVLLHGPYGTGKSLAAILTAQIANANGWTMVQVDHDQPLREAFSVALLMAPCVLVVEDIDTRITDNPEDSVELMELLDGTTTKGKQIIGLFTTNHPDKLQAGQWRKGRIDEQIEIGHLDRGKMQALVEYRLGEYNAVEDWTKVLDATDGMVPAYVDGVVRSAQLYAIADGREKITTVDLVNSARQAREQLAFQERATSYSDVEPDTIDQALQDTIETTLVRLYRQIELTGTITNSKVEQLHTDVQKQGQELQNGQESIKSDTEPVAHTLKALTGATRG